MGFVSVTCSNCAGKGLITPEGGETRMIYRGRVTCNDCDGIGSHLIHAGQIGSYRLGVDTAGTNDDEAWAVVFQRMDDDVIEVVDFMQVDRADPEVQRHAHRTAFGRNR